MFLISPNDRGVAMRKIALTLLVLIAFALLWGEDSKQATIGWLSISKAESLSRANGKPMMVYIYSNGCAWCRKFVRKTLSNPDIVKLVNEKFVPTKVNLSSNKTVRFHSKTIKEKYLGRVFLVRGTPTTVFLQNADSIIAKLPGFINHNDFQLVLKYIGDGWYKDMSYKDFVESEKKLKSSQ